jgi:TetR/AcrR family transcriptional repressor of nem operon
MAHVKATKELLIEAASRLICLHGYNHTSLDDILRESKVGKGNFYHYFKSKEALGYAIIDRIVQKFSDEVLGPIFSAEGLAPLERVERLLDHAVDSQRQSGCIGGCPMGNLAMELSDVHEGFRQRLAGVFHLWRERIRESLLEAQEEGSLDASVNPESLAHFLVASFEGAILLTKVTKEIGVMEQCARELRRHLDFYRISAGAPA